MTLRERIEGLVKLWRKRGEDDTASGKLENPWVLECADDLAAALAADGPPEAPDLRTRFEKLHKWVFDDTFEGKERHVELVELSKVLDLLSAAPSLHKEGAGGAKEGITLDMDFATAGAIGLFEFLRSKGFERASPAGRAPACECGHERKEHATDLDGEHFCEADLCSCRNYKRPAGRAEEKEPR